MSEIKNHIEKDLSVSVLVAIAAIVLLAMLRLVFADVFSSLSKKLRDEKESYSKDKGYSEYRSYLFSLYFLFINRLIIYSLTIISIVLFLAVNIFPKKSLRILSLLSMFFSQHFFLFI